MVSGCLPVVFFQSSTFKVQRFIRDYCFSDDHGFSLLHWACWDGRLNIVEMLLNRGLKINAINRCEDTPLHCAVQNNHIEVACLVRIFFQGSNRTLPRLRVKLSSSLFQLLSNKADINAYNIHGNTALHYACHFGYSDLCFELVRLGASVSNCNRYGQMPTDLCRKALRELLLNLAGSYNLPIAPVPFRENALSRMSRNKTSNQLK